MVERRDQYILEWAGHAAYVTERFSGLFARQALVDLTLECQGREIQVHKLVLASCSPVFEEILEQNLGPTMVFVDLEFVILQAIVEFMYCGEVTIPLGHLQSLLNAAQLFRNKETDEDHIHQRKTVNARSSRRTSKLTLLTNGRSSFPKSEKNKKSKLSNMKDDKSAKIKSLDDGVIRPVELNTIPCVSRSVWGDMTDIVENRETETSNCGEYPNNAKIALSLGLLPPAAALQRVQAMSEPRPRRTRSSAARPKPGSTNLKRKARANESDPGPVPKRQNISVDIINNNSNTVSQNAIQEPSQCSQNDEEHESEPNDESESTSGDR